MYRKEDVRKIFEQEKILIGNRDVFPKYRAIEIFGEEAISFVSQVNVGTKREYCSQYGIGDSNFSLEYLTSIGIEIAATYVNICTLREGGVKYE